MPLINTIGGHNDQAPIRKLKVKGGEDITAGQVVKWSATADDGITVLICGSGEVPCGVALEAIASGGYGYMQTRGIGLVALTTGGSVAAGSACISAASGAVGVDVIDASLVTPFMVALALADDSSTTLAAGDYIVCPLAGW
jgi:hypothetical protein